MTSANTDYNGFTNRATWNLSLWVSNDENLYNRAFAAVDKMVGDGKMITDEWTKAFFTIELENRFGTSSTPDGYSANDPAIDWSQLSSALREFSAFVL
jgi:hypothetical protein